MPADWLRPPAPWPAGVGALVTTRQGPAGEAGAGRLGWNLADHVGDSPDAVAGHRGALAALTGVHRVQWLRQVHGSRWVAATPDSVHTTPEADAAWTSHVGLGVAVLTADCVPVLLCDRAGRVAAVAHGGWRGLVAGVVESLVAALPVPAGELLAWIGPAIGPDAYEVGDDVASAVQALPDGAELAAACLRSGRAPGKHQLDLFTLTERLLGRAGVADVLCERICTYHDRRFYSYRREGATGRMVSLAWLRE